MRCYAYKRSDGTRLEDVIAARSQDEAFSLLRKRGIRPIKLWAAPGQRRALHALVAVGSLAVVAALLGVGWLSGQKMSRVTSETEALAEATETRHQLAEPVATDLFEQPAERFLALYAQPGREVKTPQSTKELSADLLTFLGRPSSPAREGESASASALRRIVAGMKAEMHGWVMQGCSVQDAVNRIIQRQRMEVAYRQKLIDDLAQAAKAGDEISLYETWERSNGWLKSMGIAEIPLPDIQHE